MERVTMATEHEPTKTVDATGQVCPIPLANAKQALDTAEHGEVIEILSTEHNSVPDFKSWADITAGVDLLDQDETVEAGETIYRHYIQKTQ